jgi:hypothetical protein
VPLGTPNRPIVLDAAGGRPQAGDFQPRGCPIGQDGRVLRPHNTVDEHAQAHSAGLGARRRAFSEALEAMRADPFGVLGLPQPDSRNHEDLLRQAAGQRRDFGLRVGTAIVALRRDVTDANLLAVLQTETTMMARWSIVERMLLYGLTVQQVVEMEAEWLESHGA